VKKIILAAVAQNRVIGNNGKMPWHIPEDLQHFKQLNTGHTVLMGRKTFESIGHPLPHRRNVVLSSQQISGVETFPSLDAAFQALASEEKVFIIGGGAVFAQTLSMAEEFYLTLIDKDFAGDTFFPEYEQLLKQNFLLTKEDVRVGFRFVHYIKKIV
jgi:dihydrofolate reductase